MSASYQRAYHKIKARKEEVKPRPVWGSWGRFYDRLFSLRGRLVLDFGSDIESPLYKKFQRDNNGENGKYKGYDIDEETISWLKGQDYYYDYFNDNSLRESFDTIVASEVYEHLTEPERERFLYRAHELLRSSGRLIVDVPYIANLNLIEFFKRDRSHKPIALEDEAAYFETFGFKVQAYIGGRTAPYRPLAWNIWRFVGNMALGYYPFYVALFDAIKIH
ncbi:MAG TPA: methyltransferase domain-containing protein [Candidatus Dormibacteraeota bacterium]|jgi:2-polyprenyl-3-methyl-5-hydroxy-6-metoxy-1,4-benzoquinol methylase|nr:methyltransferase domain-containing protein [Candidatus Dormibacteraeota bacterium]